MAEKQRLAIIGGSRQGFVNSGPRFEYAGRLSDGAIFDREYARAFIQRTLRESYLKQ